MPKLRHLAIGILAALWGAVPIAAYTGHYAPVCGWSTVWTLDGYQYQYVCN